jgi:hypothetical protein
MRIALVPVAIIAALALAACGGGSNQQSTEEADPVATEQQVTDSFEAWRFQRASKVGDGSTSVSVDVDSCNLGSPGVATCYETVTITDVYGKIKQNFVWDITYDEESGKLLDAVEKGASDSGTASGVGAAS